MKTRMKSVLFAAIVILAVAFGLVQKRVRAKVEVNADPSGNPLGSVMLSPPARTAGDKRQKITEFCYREPQRICSWVTEQLEKGGGKECVREFEGVAARAPQPVRLLQLPCDSLLLKHRWQRD